MYVCMVNRLTALGPFLPMMIPSLLFPSFPSLPNHDHHHHFVTPGEPFTWVLPAEIQPLRYTKNLAREINACRDPAVDLSHSLL